MEAEELAIRAKGGDQEAFCELVRTYQGAVRGYIARFVRNPEEVLDLAQETFLVAYRRLHTFDESMPFLPWVRGIARTTSLEYLRKASRRRRREEESALEESIHGWQAERMEDNGVFDAEYVDELKRCLEKLPAPSVQVMDMHYFKRFSIRHIAGHLKRRDGTVRMTLLRIRQELRKCIERQLQEEGSG